MTLCFIGNSIIDIIKPINSLEKIAGSVSGEMKVISSKEANNLIKSLKNVSVIAGGSANNSACGLSLLNEDVRFIGKTGKDSYAEMYLSSLKKYHLDTKYIVKDEVANTGLSIIYVTPDGERTMNTHMGASIKLTPADIPDLALEKIEGTFIEGYIFYLDYGREIIEKAFKLTKLSSGFSAISLSDVNCVKTFRDQFLYLLENNVIDLLFGNKKEMMCLFQSDNENDLLIKLKKYSNELRAIIMTDGENGCTVTENNILNIIKPRKVKNVIDTTGAGDLFVSGFIKGYINGYDIIKCSELGNYYASEIVQIMGGKINNSNINKIIEKFKNF
ncbi:MAG: adenosine kinase [Hyphomicrobiales bacterium]|nr:adenosine kinase [Hyphomicrobiales bacterium]